MIDGLNRDFRILRRGMFRAKQLSLNLLPGRREYPPFLQTLISQAWEEARLNPDLDLYDGRVLSLVSSSVAADTLQVDVQATRYRAFYGTNVRNYDRIGDPALCANALAVCAVVETGDGCILMGKRSRKVAEGAGDWHVPGGTLELVSAWKQFTPWLELFGLTLEPTSCLNPLAQMGRELNQEFSLEASQIRNAFCLGLGENLRIGKPEFLCWFQLDADSRTLRPWLEAAADRGEHEDVVFLPAEEIDSFAAVHQVAPIGRAALWLYLDQVLNAGR